MKSAIRCFVETLDIYLMDEIALSDAILSAFRSLARRGYWRGMSEYKRRECNGEQAASLQLTNTDIFTIR